MGIQERGLAWVDLGHVLVWAALTKISYTGGLNSKHFFRTVLEIGESEIKALTD